MAKSPVKVIGVKKVQKAGLDFVKRSQRGAVRGLKIWGEETLTITKAVHTPFKTGILRGSGATEIKDAGGIQPNVEISFGGESPADEYAVVVHENTLLKHKWGSSKYLEIGTSEESGKLGTQLDRSITREAF